MIQVHPLCNEAGAPRLTAVNGFSRRFLMLGTGTSLPGPLLGCDSGAGASDRGGWAGARERPGGGEVFRHPGAYLPPH